MTKNPDLIVLGGGPAGAVSAWLAARDGLDVLLVDPCKTPPRIEGLSPRLRHWLAGQGLLQGISGITGPLDRHVDWAGISNSNSEFVVARETLDDHLRQSAMAAGCSLIQDTGAPEDGGAVLSAGTRLRAPLVIDARGRKARHLAGHAPATLALCGWLGGAAVAQGVRLCAIASGWVWRVGLPDGRIWAQAVMDATGKGSTEQRFRAAICQAEPELASATPLGQVMARAAQPRLPATVADLALLPVGDALAAMDPLSGHGQFWAVSSALAVAAIRRSLKANPGEATEALCRDFLNQRAVGTALHQARVGRDFIRAERRYADLPFWRARVDFPDNTTSLAAEPVIRRDSAVVVENGVLARRDILRTPRSPHGVAWLGSIPAAEAWRLYETEGARGLQRRWGASQRQIELALRREMTPITG